MKFVSFWYLGPSDKGHLARAIHDEIQRECVSMDASKVSAEERAHYVRCWRNMLWSQRAPGGWYTYFDGETEWLSVAMVKLQIEADESFCLYEAAKLAEAYADSAGFVEHRLRIGRKYFKSEVSAVEAALVDMLLLRREVRQEVRDFIEYEESDDFIREKEADKDCDDYDDDTFEISTDQEMEMEREEALILSKLQSTNKFAVLDSTLGSRRTARGMIHDLDQPHISDFIRETIVYTACYPDGRLADYMTRNNARMSTSQALLLRPSYFW